MPFCFGWRIIPFGAALKVSSYVCASLSLPCPVRRPAVSIGRACRSILSFVARPLVVLSFEFCLASWGPLLVLATEILSFFLDSFEVVVEWFSSSHCLSLLHWRYLSVFRPASDGDRYLSGLLAGDCGLPLQWRVHARVWMVACLPLLRVWRTAQSRVATLNALCIDRNLFPVNPSLF